MKAKEMEMLQNDFDTVLSAIVKQGKPSKDIGRCLYRGPRGLKCAIGWLIPDDLYKPEMDTGISFHKVLDIIGRDGDNLLYLSIRVCHDNASREADNFIDVFKQSMKNVATQYSLEYKDEFQ